ncbi:CaiB/BaiF CoA-transferase family protein [Nocardioides sp. WS12]|uniref:CaiB/BaiF CoA transferase family protein n=1 Tax=Nocardioides sp. WS12 TaxID=2486272 RepID=UPI0015FE174C|nr:CaiB/BaiF CoA-transferase family protein [Nocardioides sp. WS12]
MSGPLNGLKVIELGGIGPGPHAGMVLGDLGADVARVEAPGWAARGRQRDHLLRRGKRIIEVNLKDPAERDSLLDLVATADVLIEGYRPGVTDRLGVGPETCLEVNPRLVYARVTGWGQHGTLAQQAGHDINYISITGVLHAIGRADERPTPPLNLLGDYGGGSMLAVSGILAALVERSTSGLGQVIDAAMVDGVAVLTQHMWSLRSGGLWADERGSNMLNGAAPYYGTYECSDGGYVAVGAIEPQFYSLLVQGLGLVEDELPAQLDEQTWPSLRSRFSDIFASRTRDEWAATFDGTDACVTPVLSFAEAQVHPHLAARNTLLEVAGETQSHPAPRFSRSVQDPPVVPAGSVSPIEDVKDAWRIA